MRNFNFYSVNNYEVTYIWYIAFFKIYLFCIFKTLKEYFYFLIYKQIIVKYFDFTNCAKPGKYLFVYFCICQVGVCIVNRWCAGWKSVPRAKGIYTPGMGLYIQSPCHEPRVSTPQAWVSIYKVRATSQGCLHPRPGSLYTKRTLGFIN